MWYFLRDFGEADTDCTSGSGGRMIELPAVWYNRDEVAAMSIISSTSVFTPEDLLSMRDDRRYELVGGKLVEKPVSALSSLVSGIILTILSEFVGKNRLGLVFDPDLTYQCFPSDPSLVRRPDVSFVRRGRFPAGDLPEGHVRIAPDLVVEVLSPNETAYDVDEKVELYVEAGVRTVWIVNPVARTVRVHRPNVSGVVLGEHEVLEGGDVVPGFSCPIRDIFAKVDAALAQ
jgi:Uma2 family endonuclease